MFIIRLGNQIVNMKLEIFIKNFSMIYSYIYIQAGQPPATYKGVFIMHDFNFEMNQYLTYCRTQKRLDGKTLKAYRIDLTQFGTSLAAAFPSLSSISELSPAILESYIATLHEQFKPKTVKRKLASLKAFFHYLDYRDRIVSNPFNKLHIKFREPVILPKTIPLPTIELLLSSIYHQYSHAATDFQRKNALRDAAVIELLFATGIRISELCSITPDDINLSNRTLLIFGKGSKERLLQIGNDDVVHTLLEYRKCYLPDIKRTNRFFVNQAGRPLSDQYVRRTIRKYCSLASIDMHITPHMFRHTFATSLLEADVDIRYIQEMLGHSSIHITEIYTHVSTAKQRDILMNKHPRKDFRVG